MCGIAGFHGCGNREAIIRMTDSMRHRGPDDGDIFVDDAVALGHRRLSIVDLEHGRQPMNDPQSGMTIVYNGEIYNHVSIRLELEKLGHVFHTRHSDTETLLHAFAQWGPECFTKLNGMFACAIYDPATSTIWLARDRFGEKPLFYAQNGNSFAFASEIRALKEWPGFRHAWDEANVQRFFAWNYLPGGRSVHKGCQSLPPGSWLRFDLTSGMIKIEKWWSFELAPDDALTDNMEAELAEELRRLLIQAVSRRFLADVPLGLFLSGGLDSSAILAAAAHAADPAELQTFTIGFREKSFDESAKAALVAHYLGAPNQINYLAETDLQNSIDSILGRMSEPFGDPSLVPTYHLCAFARRHVKVALSGDGGDELLGGYDPLDAIMPGQWYERLVPRPMHALARKIFNLIPASDKNMSLDFKIKRFLRGLSWPAAMRLPVWMSGLDPAETREFFTNPLNAEELFEDAVTLYDQYPCLSALAKAFMFFTRIYLSDDILVKSDRASMLVSLETRAVFLDNDLVDFCRRLPMRFKYRNGQRKYLLKKALAGWLPQDILQQPKKGFGIPLNLWLRSLPPAGGAVPGLKDWVGEKCRRLHERRKGDYRFFLWDLQAFGRMMA